MELVEEVKELLIEMAKELKPWKSGLWTFLCLQPGCWDN